jgi:hypothetical protein
LAVNGDHIVTGSSDGHVKSWKQGSGQYIAFFVFLYVAPSIELLLGSEFDRDTDHILATKIPALAGTEHTSKL